MPFHFKSYNSFINWAAARTRLKIPWKHNYPIWFDDKTPPEKWELVPKANNIIVLTRPRKKRIVITPEELLRRRRESKRGPSRSLGPSRFVFAPAIKGVCR